MQYVLQSSNINVGVDCLDVQLLAPFKAELDSHHEALSGVVCKNPQDEAQEF